MNAPTYVILTPEQWERLAAQQRSEASFQSLPEGDPSSPAWWGALAFSLFAAAIVKVIVDFIGAKIVNTLHRILITLAIFALDWIARNPEALDQLRARLEAKAARLEASKTAEALRALASPAIRTEVVSVDPADKPA